MNTHLNLIPNEFTENNYKNEYYRRVLTPKIKLNAIVQIN